MLSLSLSIIPGEIIPALLGDESSNFISSESRFDNISTINLELKPMEISDPLYLQSNTSSDLLLKSISSAFITSLLPLISSLT